MNSALLKTAIRRPDRAFPVLAQQWPGRFGSLPLCDRNLNLTQPATSVGVATTLGTIDYYGCSNRRWLSGSGKTWGGDTTEGGGGRKATFDDEIEDLNAEIAGFVGDLGDPDFDAPPAGSLRNIQTDRPSQRAPPAVPQPTGYASTTSTRYGMVRGVEKPDRLTLADHPVAVSSTTENDHDIGALEHDIGKSEWGTLMVGNHEHKSDGKGLSDTRTMKSVLVLNGAACFIAGKLSTTGEPREVVTRSMDIAARDLGLSLTVCTSNREDVLLDQLCEGGYDAIVYNPSGFGRRRQGAAEGTAVVATSQVHQVTEDCVGGLKSQSNGGSAVEYGLAHAGCPVIFVSPGDGFYDQASHRYIPRAGTGEGPGVARDGRGQSGRGVISGFSGAVSYRLAMMAVASVLDGR